MIQLDYHLGKDFVIKSISTNEYKSIAIAL